MADYRIELGVKLRDGAIQNEINEAQKTLKPIELKVDAETKELTNTIREALNSLSKGTKNALTLDTSKIEASLDKLSSVVADIKTSLGTLNSKSGMKDLLSSINQMTAALGKAENESDSLVKSLSALSKKEFGINFGFNMGKSASQVASEQGDLKRSAISQLKQQARALEDYLDSYYKVTQQGAGVAKLTQGTNVFRDYWELSPNIGDTKASLKQQMATYKQYIDLMRQAAKIKGIDLSGVTSGFSKSTEDIVEETNNAANGVEQLTQAFKGLFGGGISSEQLDSIVADLKEIKIALTDLSKGININEITQSFKEMSVVLDDITNNLAVFRNAFGNIGNGLSSSVGNATQGLKNNANILDTFKRSLQNIGMGSKEIDNVANRIKQFGVQIETLNQSKPTNKGIFSVDISGIDKFGNAVKITDQYSVATGKLVNTIDRVSTVQQKAGKSAETFAKQQKNAVTNLTNQINKLNREVNDQNAPRAIKDSSHLDTLQTKYNDIISAIHKMENASSDTFVDEQNNVKKLISEYQSLVREIRNAENVATSLRSKDIDTVKSTYGSKLDVLISKMQSSGVYTSGFEGGAENLRSILSSATDASGLVRFLNGLDKLEAGYKRANAAVKEFNRSQKVGINVSGLESKIANIQRISPEIDKFETEINGANVSVKSLLNDLSQVKTQGDFSVVNAKFKAFAEAAEAAGIAVTEVVAKAKTINQIKFELADTGANGLKYQIESIRKESQRFVGQSAELREALNHVDIAFNALNTANEVDDTQALSKAYNDLKNALESVNSQLAKNKQIETEYNSAAKLEQEKNNFSKQMQIWLSQNTAAAKQFGDRIEVIQSQLKSCDKTQLDNLKQEFRGITQEAKLAGKTGQTFLGGIKSQFAKYSQYFSIASLFQYAEQGLRSMFEQVKLIDSAMTELKKVTNETDEAYNKFLKNAATKSREIGTTIDGLVSSTADFARLGYGFEDAQGLAEVANIYAVVGDEIEGVEGATESLISTMAAFKDEMNGMSNTDFAMSIIDKFNEIGNNFAISSGGIGEALERSASSLMAANNTIDESIALITAANTVVQDPEQVGKAYADYKSGYIG